MGLRPRIEIPCALGAAVPPPVELPDAYVPDTRASTAGVDCPGQVPAR